MKGITMSESKIERTVKMTENIKKAQHSRKYTDKEVAEEIKISLNAYKSIIRSLPPKEKNQKRFIKKSIIKNLAKFYNCTTDYIQGLSDDMTRDKDGRVIIKPIDFKIKKDLSTELITFLDSNDEFQTLQDLHFLLCQCTAEYKEKYLGHLHAYADIIRKSLALELFQKYSEEDYNLIIGNTNGYNKDYTACFLSLCEANQLLKNEDFKPALKIYLKIIYDTTTKSLMMKPIANKAVEKILSLAKCWTDFPTELTVILDVLPEIKKRNFIITGLTAKELIESNTVISNTHAHAYEEIDLSKQIITMMKHLLDNYDALYSNRYNNTLSTAIT